jgi:hypothetical protein
VNHPLFKSSSKCHENSIVNEQKAHYYSEFLRSRFFTEFFVFLFVKHALNFGSAPILVAISVVAVVAEVNPVPPYCCREVYSLRE